MQATCRRRAGPSAPVAAHHARERHSRCCIDLHMAAGMGGGPEQVSWVSGFMGIFFAPSIPGSRRAWKGFAMIWRKGGPDGVPGEARADLHKDIQRAILERVHAVVERTWARLQDLHARFPADVPSDLLACVHPCPGQSRPTRNEQAEDRRWAPRFPGPGALAVVWDGRTGPPVDVRILDWSWNGLRLTSPRAFEAGSLLRVREARSNAAPYIVEVRHCGPAAEGWVLGCERARTP